MLRIRLPCCPRAVSGHAAAAPPSSVRNERRLMGTLVRLRAAHYHAVPEERRCASQQKLRANVADGSIASIALRTRVRLPPISGMSGGCQIRRDVPCSKANRYYSMISPARTSSVGGMIKPRALAALRLMTNSNLVACSIGRSAGLAPLRILSTKVAARRYIGMKSTP